MKYMSFTAVKHIKISSKLKITKTDVTLYKYHIKRHLRIECYFGESHASMNGRSNSSNCMNTCEQKFIDK
jgi:hypothetical protein